MCSKFLMHGVSAALLRKQPGILYSQITAVIEGEESPTHRAIQERIGIVRKGVLSHGVAQFFRNGAVADPRTKKPKARKTSQGRLPGVSVKEETLATSIKHENPDGNVTISAADDQGNTTPSPHRDSNPTIASNQPKNRSTRKRRRSDADTGSESASMAETSDTEVSLVAPNFDMKLRPEHRRVNTYASDGENGELDSDDSDGAWVPHAEDVGHRSKRVRR
jgi:hypothetical protein